MAERMHFCAPLFTFLSFCNCYTCKTPFCRSYPGQIELQLGFCFPSPSLHVHAVFFLLGHLTLLPALAFFLCILVVYQEFLVNPYHISCTSGWTTLELRGDNPLGDVQGGLEQLRTASQHAASGRSILLTAACSNL